MQIPANPALGAPGAARQSPAAGPARQVNTQPRPGAKNANPSHAGGQAVPVRKSTQTAGNPGADLARARSLEQAVQTLADQGRLPPRGSLIDLRA
jgi:hypothetical protein